MNYKEALEKILYIAKNDDCQELCPAFKENFKDLYGDCNCNLATISIATQALSTPQQKTFTLEEIHNIIRNCEYVDFKRNGKVLDVNTFIAEFEKEGN